MVAGGVCQTPSYLSCKSETEVKNIFKRQLDVFMKKNVDFLIAEVEPPPPLPPVPFMSINIQDLTVMYLHSSTLSMLKRPFGQWRF